MYILGINMWFQKLMKQFFFGIDQVVYNGISSIYDLLIAIARTSVLTQTDILDMADRIYKLLAIFMIFKVTLSLITYVVNPDDFSDKSKGISKLSMNIIVSLGLLILTPYIFNMAYRLQTIILEDNTLGTLIFGSGDNNTSSDFINTAGDDMAFITMSAFFSPNTAITSFQDCVELTVPQTQTIDGKQVSVTKFNPKCSGLTTDGKYEKDTSLRNTMASLTYTDDNGNDKFPLMALQNYVVGVENRNLGLMFRTEIAVATVDDNSQFVMDYKYVFSTVVGVVVVLLLISFCMDVALRSIKLAFLQLIAPIPILSYVDPKSGKDGMFKKWYQLCFKTYLSLFIRILALYFAIYIIEKVADLTLVDIVDGTYQVNPYIKIFVIIGALMFAKDLPKILEGLGIKLDGDGKFFLNPLKKFEESTLGGKNITGMARGAMIGTAGALTGAGLGRGISGAWRGLTSGKGWKETGKAETEMNKKMRQARLDGSTFGGRLGSGISRYLGLPTNSESIEGQIHSIDENIKERQNRVKELELTRDTEKSKAVEEARKAKAMQTALASVKETAIEKMKAGKGQVGKEYERALDYQSAISGQLGQTIVFPDGTTRKVTIDDITAANEAVRELEKNGWMRLVDETRNDSSVDAKLANKLKDAYQDFATIRGVTVEEAEVELKDGSKIDIELGKSAGAVGNAEAAQRAVDEKYYEEIKQLKDNIELSEERKRQLYEEQRRAKANESVNN